MKLLVFTCRFFFVVCDGLEDFVDQCGGGLGILSLSARVVVDEVQHRDVRRALVRGCVGGGVRIELTKAVDAHEVERGVGVPVCCWVGGVLRVGIKAAVVDDESVRRGAAGVGVAVLGGAGLVHVGQEFLDRPGDWVRLVEGAEHAWFVAWVVELPAVEVCLGLVGGDAGPGGDVLPHIEAGEKIVRVEDVLFGADFDVVVAVGESGRPIHQALRLKGGRVEPVQAGVDVLGDAAGDSAVFVRGDVAGEPHPDTPALVVGGVAECGVGEPGVWQGVGEHSREVDVFGEVVEVEGDQAAGVDVAFAAPPVFEVSADESADVLVLVLLPFRKLGVLVLGEIYDDWFVCHCRHVLECGEFVGPPRGGFAGSCADFEFSVFHGGAPLRGGLRVGVIELFLRNKKTRTSGCFWCGLVTSVLEVVELAAPTLRQVDVAFRGALGDGVLDVCLCAAVVAGVGDVLRQGG